MEALIVFLPFFAAFFVGLSTTTIDAKKAQFFTCSAVTMSAILSAIVFYQVVIGNEPRVVNLIKWISVGSFHAEWSLRVDALTAVMLVVVTWVSALVHIYSVGYMHHDPYIPRFMAYLSLFTFFMLMLVTSDNLIQLFLGWEGVGLCSYLLIGFWYQKPSANAAAIKAFLVNRVGDFGFALGIFATFIVFDTIEFTKIFADAPNKVSATLTFLGVEYHALTLICILLFIGAMGKSAQLGLHTWLPDAMEGPTPVSALIHAATMVTAGVFLVARCSPLYELAPDASMLVAVVGGLTCLFAATIAITQNDIKRVIAYSTCSQLGYMFFACGVGAYAAGIFHLMTHGFFKALLFLGAGSVIHAMSEEQDMRKMGGIYNKIPFTYLVMLIGTVAIVGIPPLAGYYSKDIVIESAYAAGQMGNWSGELAFWLGIIAAGFTAFYSWRLIFMTFHGQPRASKKVMDRIHESPLIMTFPLGLLALGAIFAGIIGYHNLGMVASEGAFWNGSIVMLGEKNILEAAHNVPSWVKFLPLVVGLVGLFIAYRAYITHPDLPTKIAKLFAPLYVLFYNKWFIDELYNALFVRPAMRLGIFLWKVVDIMIIDGLGPNGVANLARALAVRVSKFQTGYLYHYAFVMLLGVIALITWYLIRVVS